MERRRREVAIHDLEGSSAWLHFSELAFGNESPVVSVTDGNAKHSGALDGFRLSTQGTTMLGVPIGNRDYRRLMAERKLTDMQPNTAALQAMGPRIATSLVLQS